VISSTEAIELRLARGSGHGTDLSVLALTEYQRPKTVTVRLS